MNKKFKTIANFLQSDFFFSYEGSLFNKKDFFSRLIADYYEPPHHRSEFIYCNYKNEHGDYTDIVTGLLDVLLENKMIANYRYSVDSANGDYLPSIEVVPDYKNNDICKFYDSYYVEYYKNETYGEVLQESIVARYILEKSKTFFRDDIQLLVDENEITNDWDYIGIDERRHTRIAKTLRDLESKKLIEISNVEYTNVEKNNFRYVIMKKAWISIIDKTGLEQLIIKNNNSNKIKEILICKNKNYSMIIVGETSSAIVIPKLSDDKNGWVAGLYEIGKNGSCSYTKGIEAVSYNIGIDLYNKGQFNKTTLLKKDGDKLLCKDGITIKNISEDGLDKKRKKLNL